MRRSQLCQQLRSHLVATLDAAPYQQDGESWHTALRPMRAGLDLEPEPLAHLALSVFVANTASLDTYRHVPGRDMRSAVRLEVAFNYRLRPDSQVTDWDLASDASEDVVKAVFNEDAWSHGQCEVVRVEDGFNPQFTEDEIILGVTLAFLVLYRPEI